MSHRPLAGKSAIVTGVSSGFGCDLVRTLAVQGARVLGIARRADRGATLEAELRDDGLDFRFVAGDVTQAADCHRAVEEAEGSIDILINNAGVSGPVAPVEELSDDDWDGVFDVNVRGTFLMCRAVLPLMYEAGQGVVLNVASINAVEAVANMAAYNASKAAVVQLSRTLAVEAVDRGVRVNTIVLGGVPSEMNTEMKQAMGRRLRTPDWTPSSSSAATMSGDDAARALAVLCTDDAAAITGAVIAVDGAVSAGRLASAMIYLSSAELLPTA